MPIPRFPKYSTISGDHKKLFDELIKSEKDVLSELLNSNFQTFDKLKGLELNKKSTIRLLNELIDIGFKKSHIKNIVGEINQSFISDILNRHRSRQLSHSDDLPKREDIIDKIDEVCQENGFRDLRILADFGWTLECLDNLDIYNKITRVKQSILDGSREITGKTRSSRRKISRFTGAKKTINKTRMTVARFKKKNKKKNKKKKKKKKSKKIHKK